MNPLEDINLSYIIYFSKLIFPLIIFYLIRQKRAHLQTPENFDLKFHLTRFGYLFLALSLVHLFLTIEMIESMWAKYICECSLPDPFLFEIMYNGNSTTLSLASLIADWGVSLLTAYLYFTYDRHFCSFRMKGLPAYTSITSSILYNIWWVGYVEIMGLHNDPIVTALRNWEIVLYLVIIVLVLVNFWLSRKTTKGVMPMFWAFILSRGISYILILIQNSLIEIAHELGFIFTLMAFINVLIFAQFWVLVYIGLILFIKKTLQIGNSGQFNQSQNTLNETPDSGLEF